MPIAHQRIEHLIVVSFPIHHMDGGLGCVKLSGRLPDLLFPSLVLGASIFGATHPGLEASTAKRTAWPVCRNRNRQMSEERLFPVATPALDSPESLSLSIVAIQEFGGIVDDEEVALRFASFAGCFDVRLQDQFGGHPVIGKEAVRRFKPRAVEDTRKAQTRINRQPADQTSQPHIEPLILEIRASNLERQLFCRDGSRHP